MQDPGPIALAERVLAVLELGSFSATYKYALFTAILDLCLERTSASEVSPTVLTTRQLAEKVTELYWNHALPYEGGSILRQGGVRSGNQAEILSAIAAFRSPQAGAPGDLFHRARLTNPDGFERLVRTIEWKLIEMPIPRLQVIGRGDEEDRFLYEYGWTRAIARRTVAAYQRGDSSAFDNRLLLQPHVAEHLIELSGVLRPVVRREWALMVAGMNALPDSKLEEFLFGAARVPLDTVRGPLRELQEGRCFYCDGRLDARGDVDHFIPWSRYADNTLDNLVVAHPRCNGQKRDFFAAVPHLVHWADRSLRHGTRLEAVSKSVAWPRDAERSRAVASALYTRLPVGARLWVAGDEFVPIDRTRVAEVFMGAAA
jgi:hypothetical protein